MHFITVQRLIAMELWAQRRLVRLPAAISHGKGLHQKHSFAPATTFNFSALCFFLTQSTTSFHLR